MKQTNFLALPLSVLLAAGLFACANASTPVPDTGADTNTADTVEEDAAEDAADAAPDIVEDVAADPDVAEDIADEPEPDVAVDLGPDLSNCEVISNDCEPRTVACSSDGFARDICDGCGAILRTDDCAERELCDDTSGTAECIPCTGSNCADGDSCMPGVQFCTNFSTGQGCNADGSPGAQIPCPSGGRCVEGFCHNTGATTGAACTLDADAVGGCMGGFCICGDAYRTANGTVDCQVAGSALGSGYCTTSNCGDNHCDPFGEVCADFSVSGAHGGGEFCVRDEGCNFAGEACGAGTMSCQQLPVITEAGDREWELGCWLGLQAPIGAQCSGDVECIGGDCLTETASDTTYRYCSADCGAGMACPDNSACALYPGSDDRWQCMALANGTACPRLISNSFDFESRSLPRFGSSQNVDVCFVRD